METTTKQEGKDMSDTYVLTTRTKQDCEQATASSPINGISVGDIVVTGFGTLTWHHREVVDVTTVPEIGCYKVTFADGDSITDSPAGFWYAVIKADPKAQQQTAQAAAAFARAWDRKR